MIHTVLGHVVQGAEAAEAGAEAAEAGAEAAGKVFLISTVRISLLLEYGTVESYPYTNCCVSDHALQWPSAPSGCNHMHNYIFLLSLKFFGKLKVLL